MRRHQKACIFGTSRNSETPLNSLRQPTTDREKSVQAIVLQVLQSVRRGTGKKGDAGESCPILVNQRWGYRPINPHPVSLHPSTDTGATKVFVLGRGRRAATPEGTIVTQSRFNTFVHDY